MTVVEASFAELQAAMHAGQITARCLVEEYLARIDRYDDTLGAALTNGGPNPGQACAPWRQLPRNLG